MQKQNHSKKTPQKTKLGFIVTLCCTNTIILKNMLTVVKKKTQIKPLLFLELCNACSIL